MQVQWIEPLGVVARNTCLRRKAIHFIKNEFQEIEKSINIIRSGEFTPDKKDKLKKLYIRLSESKKMLVSLTVSVNTLIKEFQK